MEKTPQANFPGHLWRKEVLYSIEPHNPKWGSKMRLHKTG